MKGTLITLSGIDGSGKSSVSRELQQLLEQDGFDVATHYGRYTSKLARPIMVAGESYLQSSSGGDYSEYSSKKSSLLGSTFTRTLYELVLMLDYIPFLTTEVKLKLLANEYVICDRYFYDTLLKNFGGQIVTNSDDAIRLLDRYRRFVPEPDYSYFLDISINESMSRKDDIPSIEYIEEQYSLYEQFVPTTSMKRLDGGNSVDDIIHEIYEDVI